MNNPSEAAGAARAVGAAVPSIPPIPGMGNPDKAAETACGRLIRMVSLSSRPTSSPISKVKRRSACQQTGLLKQQ